LSESLVLIFAMTTKINDHNYFPLKHILCASLN